MHFFSFRRKIGASVGTPSTVIIMSEPALRLPLPEPQSGSASPSTPSSEPGAEANLLDTAVAEKKLDLASALRTIAARHGKAYQQVLLEIAKTSFGPGKLSFDEYITLRLFDDAALGGADKTEFVGLDASRRIWMTANYNNEWWGLMQNKLAVTTLLGGYGFPVIPTLAFFSDTLQMRGTEMLADTGALARFLRTSRAYPLFGKPMDALRSIGSVSLEGYDAASDCLRIPGGRSRAVADFVAEVCQHFKAGYLFQRRVEPHAAIRSVVGDRLATVRVLTTRTAAGVRVHRAAWKIPAGSNVADNFWRAGNLLATLDLETGTVVRVIRGSGLAMEEITHHPDSGAPLIGMRVPDWAGIKALAAEAAGMLGEIRLIGWDMAASVDGPLIVEPNYTPDFDMVQLADRRGMLDPAFNAFLAECKAGAVEAKKKIRHIHRAEGRERMRKIGQSIGGM